MIVERYNRWNNKSCTGHHQSPERHLYIIKEDTFISLMCVGYMEPQKQKQKKSKFLGEGSYGCVVEPRVPCNKDVEIYQSNKANTKGAISKLFKYDGDDFKLETALARKMSTWDRQGDYFILPYKSCYIKPAELKNNPAVKECGDFNPTMKYIPQLVLPYGGEELVKYLDNYQKKFPITHWILLLKNLLEGIKMLIKNKVIHQDLHTGNVLYNPADDKLRLIDFGLSIDFDAIYNTTLNPRITHTYHAYPPEYMFSKLYLTHMDLSFDDIMRKWKNEVICENPYGAECYKYYDLYIASQDLQDNLKSVYDWYRINPAKWFNDVQNYKDRIDLYSVGMICIDIHGFLDISMLTAKQYDAYIKLIRGLILPDVRIRLDIHTALEHYEKLVRLISRG